MNVNNHATRSWLVKCVRWGFVLSGGSIDPGKIMKASEEVIAIHSHTSMSGWILDLRHFSWTLHDN